MIKSKIERVFDKVMGRRIYGMKTICIAGKNDIAVEILLYCKQHYPQHRMVCVTNRNETGINSWQKSLKWFAEKEEIEILTLQDVYEIDDLLFLSLEFDRIIRPSKFKSKELYNIHFSMLPKYKGMFTSILPILNGEKHTGVTLHRIRAGIDTGEIIEQSQIDIEDVDSSLDIYKKCIKNGTGLVLKNLEELLQGSVKSTPQPKSGSTYYSTDAIDYSNLNLDVNKTAYQIQNQIRAFCFRPYQLLSWNGTRYIECKILDAVSEQKPGTILEDTYVLTVVATVDYDVILYKDTFNELLEAIKQGNNGKAKYLCESHKIIESQEKHGWSALTVAVYNNNFEMVRFLVEKGADIHICNNNGTTLLMYAKNCFVNTGDSSIINYLLEKGLSPYQKDYFGKNLFDYCQEEGVLERIQEACLLSFQK